MADLVPAQGIVSYNGVVFGPKTETLELSGEPQEDAAGRTYTHVVYTLRLRTRISNLSGTDTDLDNLRNKLLQPAAALEYSQKGFGTFAINTSSGGQRDVSWGPKPRLLSFKPAGANKSVVVEWSCTVAIPQCSGAVYQTLPLESNWRVGWEYDEAGYSTVTTSGHLRIPQTRGSPGERTVRESADPYRERVTPKVPVGFRRTRRWYKLDESKCRLDFEFVDVELDGPAPPPDVVRWEGEHVYQSRPKSLVSWQATLSADYHFRKGVNPMKGWKYFFDLLKERVGYVYKYGADPVVVITGLSMREPQLSGRPRAAFSASYALTTKIETFLRASGLYTPVPNSDEALWSISMTNAFSPRGLAAQYFSPADDAIVDLCSQAQVSALRTGDVRDLKTMPFAPPIEVPIPSVLDSWLGYESRLRVEVEDQTVEHKPLDETLKPESPSDPLNVNVLKAGGPGNFSGAFNYSSRPGHFTTDQGYRVFYGAGKDTAVFQERGRPSIYVVLEGRAMRAGYPIDPPQLVAVAGVPVVPVNVPGRNGFVHWIAANYGVPVVVAYWCLRYAVKQIPSERFGVPPNPIP